MSAPLARRRPAWLGHLLPGLLFVAAATLLGSQVAALDRPGFVLEMARPWAEIGVVAVAMTAVMLTGGIDLSVGAVIALTGMVLGQLWQRGGLPIGAACAAAVLVAALAGLGNGILITAGIAPLVATLATMALYAGLAIALASGERVTGLPESLTIWGQGTWQGIPCQFWLLLIALAAGWLLVHHTRWGRYLFALGDNPLAARYAAVPVRRIECALYTLSGAVAGLVGLFYTARGGAAIADAGRGLELAAIACVVVGGTRVTGGVGGIAKTALGIAIVALLDIGLELSNVRPLVLPWSGQPWQIGATGRLIMLGVLVIAVAIWNERWSAASRDDS